PARRGGLVLGAEGDPGRGEPGNDPARVALCPAAGPRPGEGDRAGGTQPGRARMGPGRRPQRRADDVPDRARLLSPAAHAHAARAGLLCCADAWRQRSALTASGWATVALLVTLSWVLPWYVLWVLPLAALSSSRRLRAVSAVLGVYLIISWAPASTLVWSAIGFHPEKTSLGRLHQRYVKEFLN